ncbi:hypothetical protein [Tsuneonella amylolytica]|uniref:hypothetical protein n=1 Tax=Tsuneonella amylolytica TaxID=2338327 RepID=UPI0013C425E4|nr:hypothetical protein [Tsuneonella amylolytica]
MHHRKLIAAILACSSLAISACSKEATGQVAAVINGDEITLQEINAELGNMAIPEGTDKKIAQSAALQRIVDRRLMAQAAKEDGLDKTPEYILRKRQLDDALLAQMLNQRAERTVEVPDQKAIDEFVSQNGGMFANRTIFTVDRLQFPLPGDFGRLKALENDHSMAEVTRTLDSLGIKYQRGNSEIDALQLGPERLQRIQSLPSGEPFVVPENGIVTVAVVTGTRTEPITGDQARPLAAQALRNKQLGDTMMQRLKAARASAKVEYQNGFAPPKETAAEGGAR